MAEALAALPELPTFKGRPGWEFTDLSGVDVDSFTPEGGANEDIDHPLLGSVVPADDPFVARNDAGRSGGTLIHVPAGERLDSRELLRTVQSESGTALHHRLLIVLE